MRPGVEGTVSREMEAKLSLATGIRGDGKEWQATVPSPVIKRMGGVEAMVRRGQSRYNIYCAPCHSFSGDGKGMVSRRAAALGASGLIAPSLHDDRLRHIPDGQLYATIKNGLRNMPSYQHNIPSDDRWAIVQYVRALQLSQLPQNTEQSQ